MAKVKARTVRVDAGDTGFAARLKALRADSGLSQVELARMAGLGLGTVTKLEQGLQGPSWAAVLVMARVLGVRTDDFRPLDDPRPPPPVE